MTPDHQLLDHAAFVRRLAHGLLADPAAADDVAQEALLKLWQQPPRLAAAVRGWLQQVVRRLAARRLRSQRRCERREAAAAAPGLAAPPLDGLVRAETLRAVGDAVTSLPPELRDVVLLRYHEGLPPRRVAVRLGVDVAAVDNRLRRAHRELAQRLRRRFGSRWQGGVAALAGVLPQGSLLGITMTAKSKLAVVAVPLLLLAGISLWLSLPEAGPPTPATVPAAPAAVAAAPVPPPEPPRRSEQQQPSVETPPPAATPGRSLLRGRVVDARRRPVAGAGVQLAGGDDIAGASGDDGSFALVVPACRGPRRGELLAMRGDDAGVREFAVPGSDPEVDVGCIALQPAGTLRVRVLRRGQPEPEAKVDAVRLSGAAAGTAITDARGEAVLERLPAGRYLLRARAADGALAAAIGDAYAGNRELVPIDLADAAALRVLARRRSDQQPLPAMAVLVWVQVPTEGGGTALVPWTPAAPRTGADGTVLIEGLRPERALRVAVRRDPAFAEPDGGRELLPGSNLAVFEFDDPSAPWFELQVSHEQPPRDGDEFEVVTFAGSRRGSASLRDGRLWFGGELPPSGTTWFAVDGARSGDLYFTGERGGERPVGTPVGFCRLRTCTVRLTDAGGRPLVGLPVCLQASADAGDAIVRRTGGDGAAVFTGLPAVSVHATLDDDPASATGSEQPLGTVDLAAADGRLDVQLGVPTAVSAQVTIDGAPGLPGELQLASPNGVCANVREDVEHGRLQFELYVRDPATPTELRLYGPWQLSTGIARVPAAATEAAVEFRLQRLGSAVAAVVPAADGESQLFVERIFPGGVISIWTHVPAGRQGDALPRFTNLEAGRYRLRDALSNVRGPEVEVDRSATARLELDLSRVVAVSGRVVASRGAVRRGTYLELAGADGKPLRKLMTAADGSFALRLVVDRADLQLCAVSGQRRSPPLPLSGPMRDVQLVLP